MTCKNRKAQKHTGVGGRSGQGGFYGSGLWKETNKKSSILPMHDQQRKWSYIALQWELENRFSLDGTNHKLEVGSRHKKFLDGMKWQNTTKRRPQQAQKRIGLSLFTLAEFESKCSTQFMRHKSQTFWMCGGKWREHFARDKNAWTKEFLDPEVVGWIKGQEVERGVKMQAPCELVVKFEQL